MADDSTVKAAHLNELRAAAIERGLINGTTWPEIATDSTRSSAMIAAIRTAIDSGLTAGTWWNVDWTDAATWTVRQWTGSASESSPSYATPYYVSNIFKVAFSDATKTTWRDSTGAGTTITARQVNDTYLVLDLLRSQRITGSTTSNQNPENNYFYYYYSTCTGALTACDARTTWQAGEILGGTSDVSLSTVAGDPIRYAATRHRAMLTRCGYTIPASTLNAYQLYRPGAWRQDNFAPPNISDTARDIQFRARVGTAAAPTNWTDSQSYGDSVDDYLYPSGNHLGVWRCPQIATPSSGTLNFVVALDERNASGSLLCSILGAASNAHERVESPFGPMIAEIDYTYVS